MKIFNSLTRQKEELKTIEPNKIRFYSCGPTVYNLIHIGNLRSAMVADMFQRCWRYLGYEVQYVRNYTDIDDKIIKKANEEGRTPSEVSEFYITEVEKDYASAGVQDPDQKPKVTQHLNDIIELIESIIQNGHAYEDQGNVIFSVESFEPYGRLSGKNLEDLKAGARVEVRSEKSNPLDFYLWKAAKPGEPSWPSPWGNGRPGWHIECSAMIRSILGDQIDVHHGGVDLVFPHHENEIAQSECATGHAPFARYWLHHEFVTLNEQKMSKSLGNVFLAREFLQTFGGEVARYFMLSPHYRSPIDFSKQGLLTAVSGLERLYESLARATTLAATASGDVPSDFQEKINLAVQKAKEAWMNDFHSPGVMSASFDLIRDYNKAVDSASAAEQSSISKAFIDSIQEILGTVMGLGKQEPIEYLEFLSQVKRRLQGQDHEARSGGLSDDEIEALVQERQEARKAKNFKRADEIRDQLQAQHIELRDSPQGVQWRRC